MRRIDNLTDNANQDLKIVLDDGTIINLAFRFYANQLGWFYDVAYQGWSSNGRRLVMSPNMLRQFRDIIPFGLACTTIDGYEPFDVIDFRSGRVSLFVLNQEDVAFVEANICNAN